MTALDSAPVTVPEATIDRFHAEAAALRKTLDELDHIHRQAWQKESAAARKAIAGLQADLALATAEARAERAATREDLNRALSDLTDAWRARVDDLHVQGRLAEMDARDAVDRLRHEGHRSVSELRAAALHAIDRLRSAFTS